MPYVIFTANGDEIDRRELTAPVTIGRAQDADIPVRDILLSRTHCRLEPSGEHWVVTDLGSKNGTYLGNRQLTRHQLKDGDELRLGRTRMTFKASAFEPAPDGTKRKGVVRPVDPTEALAGTVAGFLLVEPGEVERQAGAPIPQPRPPEPTSYASEDVYGMLNEIASSSWDSIQAQASRPLVMERPLPRPSGYREAPIPARRTRVAFSLQAPAEGGENPAVALSGLDATDPPATPGDPHAPGRHRSASRWWTVSARVRRQVALGLVSAAATVLLVGAWVVAVNQGPRRSAAGTELTPRSTSRAISNDLTDITFPTPAPAPPPAKPAEPTVAAEPVAQAAVASRHTPDLPPPDRITLKAAAKVAAVHFLLVR